jgi:heme A synthase
MASLLIGLIFLVLIVGIAWWIIQQVPLPPPMRWVVTVVFGLIVLLVVLNYLPAGALPRGRWG